MKLKVAVLAALLLGICLAVQKVNAFTWWGNSSYSGRSEVTHVRSKARLYRLISRYDFVIAYVYDSSYSSGHKLNRMARIFDQLSVDEDYQEGDITFVKLDLAGLGAEERAELRNDLELKRSPTFITFRFEQWSNKDVLRGFVSFNTLDKFVARRLEAYQTQKERREEESYRSSRRSYYRPRVRFGYGYGYPHHGYYGHRYGGYGHHGSGFSIGFGF